VKRFARERRSDGSRMPLDLCYLAGARPPVSVIGPPDQAGQDDCREFGATVAAELAE
jgi:hypothetical protein